MRLTYDRNADALSLTVSTAAIAGTEEVAPNVMVDLDEAGEIVAIEILGVSRRPGAEPMALAFQILGPGQVHNVPELPAAAE
jgi:uncharacterized protein YuzE